MFPPHPLALRTQQLQGNPTGIVTWCLGQKMHPTVLVHAQQLFRGGSSLESTWEDTKITCLLHDHVSSGP